MLLVLALWRVEHSLSSPPPGARGGVLWLLVLSHLVILPVGLVLVLGRRPLLAPRGKDANRTHQVKAGQYIDDPQQVPAHGLE